MYSVVYGTDKYVRTHTSLWLSADSFQLFSEEVCIVSILSTLTWPAV